MSIFMQSGLFPRLLSILLLLLLWQSVTTFLSSGVLPPPANVFAFVVREAQSGDLAHNLTATMTRVIASFTLAMIIGGAIGLALGRSPASDRILDSWLMILLNTPALVVIILCYVWLGLSETAAIAAVTLNKIPNVAVIMREGARSLDPQIEELRQAFRFDRRTWIRHVLFPQVQPYAVAAARSGLALVWKIVLVVELLGRPDGVGYALSYYFQLFNVAALLGYSLVFTAVVLLIDTVVLQPLESYARRWRLVSSAA
ncbi:ABC transporter permease subunit [Microvirga sp. 0TCS3.31]